MATYQATRPRKLKTFRTVFPHFADGAGAFDHIEGRYAIGLNVDTRWGPAIPGPREVADRTGLPAAFRVRAFVRHNDVQILGITDGTDTRIYRLEAGVWALKGTFTGAVITPDGLCSFNDGTNSTLIVCLGNATAFQFSTNDGTAWTASTKSGNAKYANRAIVQQNGLSAARVTFARNPNEIRFSTDMTNTGNVTVSSTIGDASAQTYFTSLDEDDLGVLLAGMRHALYTMDSNGIVVKLTPDYPDPPADAGGQGDRDNFELHLTVGGRKYYNYSGYELGEYFHGQWNPYMAPKWAGTLIPRMHLPINAGTVVGEWLILALGTKSTLKSATNAPGGAALLQNTFGTASDIWAAHYQPNPETGAMEWVYHGILLSTTSPLRFMWADEDDNYVYLASGDSEAVNTQQRRAFFLTTPPQFHLLSGIVNLQTGQWRLETGRITNGDPLAPNRFLQAAARTLGLADATPSLQVLYRDAPDYESTAYSSLATWIDNYHPEKGVRFPPFQTFRVANLDFRGTGNASGNTYAILISALVDSEEYVPRGLAHV